MYIIIAQDTRVWVMQVQKQMLFGVSNACLARPREPPGMRQGGVFTRSLRPLQAALTYTPRQTSCKHKRV